MIKISIYVGWLYINKSILKYDIITDVLDSCSISNCSAEVLNNDFIKVTGKNSDLYKLLHELTYTYSICLE